MSTIFPIPDLKLWKDSNALMQVYYKHGKLVSGPKLTTGHVAAVHIDQNETAGVLVEV